MTLIERERVSVCVWERHYFVRLRVGDDRETKRERKSERWSDGDDRLMKRPRERERRRTTL